MTDASVSEKVGTYQIDPAHSEVGFVVRHMGFSKVRGRFERFEGTVSGDPTDLGSLEARVEIDAKSITTDEQKRDEHLRSNDFLDIENNPKIIFESHRVTNVDGRKFTVEGDLSIRGVTKRVELKGTFLGEGKDPWGGTRVGFEATTTVNRKDFGVNWNAALETGGFLVGDNVEIHLDVQAVRADEDE